MKIQQNHSPISFSSAHGFTKSMAEKFAKIDKVGEGANIALDFFGKAAIVPAVIMMTSKEDKEEREYCAIKNPVAAVVQLLLEVPILLLGSKLINKLANQGKLDKEGSKFSYNEHKHRDIFISKLNSEGFEKSGAELVENLKKKGLNRNIKESIEELIENGSKELKQLFKNYETAHKRLYHLENRACFVAAIVLTPLLCKIENYFFPKIMKMIKKPQEQASKTTDEEIITFNEYKQILKEGAK